MSDPRNLTLTEANAIYERATVVALEDCLMGLDFDEMTRAVCDFYTAAHTILREGVLTP